MTYVPFSGAHTAVSSAPMSWKLPTGLGLVSPSRSLVTLARLVPVPWQGEPNCRCRSVALFMNKGSTSTVGQNPAESPCKAFRFGAAPFQ